MNIFSKKKKNKMKKRTKFTIISIINLLWYTIVVLVLSYHDKMVPGELTIGWFAAWTIELGLLYGIKVKSKDAVSSSDSVSDSQYFPISAQEEFDAVQSEGDSLNYDNDLG